MGIAGLMGSGRTELAMSVFGKAYGRNITGTLRKDGKEIRNQSITEAIENGFAYVTEDRKEYGLILMDDIKRNISLTGLSKLAKNMVIDEREEILVAEDMRKKLKIKTPNILQKTGNLSGEPAEGCLE